MSESESDSERDGGTTGWKRVVVAAVVVFVVTTPVVAVLTALTLAESAVTVLLFGLGVGLLRAYLFLPLGTDLTSSPALGIGVTLAGLAAAVAGPLLAIRYGLGLFEPAMLAGGGAGAYLLGLILVGLGVGSVPTYRQLGSAFGPDPGDARPGRVALGGRVEPVRSTAAEEAATEPFEAPFSLKPTVCLEARVTERSRYERQGKDLLVEERRTVPFELHGTAGRVRVEPEGADLRLDLDLQADVAPEDVPDDVAAYLSANGVTPRPDGTPRTFIERRLEPGEAATVVGEARRRDGRLVVVDPIVEDGPLDATLSAYRTAIVRGVGGGAVLAIAGLAGLFVAF